MKDDTVTFLKKLEDLREGDVVELSDRFFLTKKKAVYIGKDARNKIIPKIKKFIPKCMRYKLCGG